MISKQKTLETKVLERYDVREFPALRDQWDRWSDAKPFRGVRILDATPLFFNTIVKHLALLRGGAELTAACSDAMPYDAGAAALLKECGVPVVFNHRTPGDSFDIVLDCSGAHCDLRSKFGYAELTRSGIHVYKDRNVPLFAADSGRIKKIETCLGTGDGCLRALRKLGFTEWKHTNVLLFGYGKVGRGIAMYFQMAGARVSVVDKAERVSVPDGIELIDLDDAASLVSAVRNAKWIVTATGIPAALAPHAELLRNSAAMLVNMGAVDEFGPDMPEERVLQRKQPLNFILEEPTLLRYIDPTMALDNEGALVLLNGGVPRAPGLLLPEPALENAVLAPVLKANLITHEIRKAGI